MLIVDKKENLEKLKGFGFKPKYNEDTGEIYKYVCEKEVTLMTIIKGVYQRGQYDYVEYWKVIFEEKCNETVELLYDLINAGIIKKDKE